MQPNLRRILEAILVLIEEAGQKGAAVTQYEVAKAIFLADVDHLNKYGRPVTFDNYVAMRFGPVPRQTYDMLKPAYVPRRELSDSWPLWDRESAPECGPKAFKFVRPRRPANRKLLSKSDVSALCEALDVVKSLGFAGLRDHTHKHPAYVKAWKGDGDRKAYDIDYSLLLSVKDDDLLHDLEHASKHM